MEMNGVNQPAGNSFAAPEPLTPQPVSATTVRDLVTVLFRRKGTILLALLAVPLAAWLGTDFKTPRYEAQAKLLISSEKQVFSPYSKELMAYFNTEIARTNSEIVKSDSIIRPVVAALGLQQRPWDDETRYAGRTRRLWFEFRRWLRTRRPPRPQSEAERFERAVLHLKRNIKVAPINDTNLFTITARDYDPDRAMRIANALSRAFVLSDLEQQMVDLSQRYGSEHPIILQAQEDLHALKRSLDGRLLPGREAFGPASIKIVDQAQVPIKAAGPSRLVIMALALGVGAVLGLLGAFLYERLDQTFWHPREAAVVGLPVLASVPAVRIGDRGLRAPTAPREWNMALRLLAERLGLMSPFAAGRILIFVAAASGEGCTSLTAGLGAYVAQTGKRRVLLVDAESRRPRLHRCFGLKREPGFSEILAGRAAPADTIKPCAEGLFLLPNGCPSPGFAGHGDCDPKWLSDLSRDFDCVLVDGGCLGVETARRFPAEAEWIWVLAQGRVRRQTVHYLKTHGDSARVAWRGIVFNRRTFPVPSLVYRGLGKL